MYVLNRCRLDYKYRLSPCSPIVSKTISSNIVSTQIIKDNLKIVKFVDKEKAGVFDSLKYTIFIYNISNSIISNIFFRDNIPKDTRFIENSLTINNIKRKCLNPKIGFCIKKLQSKEKVKISFKVIIVNSSCFCINNTSNIMYDYIYNIQEKPIKICKQSNTVKTKCENNILEEFSIKDIIKLPISIDCIIKINCDYKILNYKIVNSYIKDKCGLLIFVEVKYKIFYRANGKNFCAEYVSGFSNFIIVPRSIIYLNSINMEIEQEYMFSKLINRNVISIDNIFLIYC